MKALSAVVFLGLLTRLSAMDYYVSPTGNDARAGTAAEPWATFSHALGKIQAGDTLHLLTGIYSQRLQANGLAGTEANPIVIRGESGAIIDGSSLSVPAGGRAGLVVLNNCSHLKLENLEIRNWATANATRIPVGIQVEGSGTGVALQNCHVHHIHQNSTSQAANGFGIAVYGTQPNPIDAFVIANCEIHDLRTGQSESVVLNGNVTNFLIQENHVHHGNNIGIDLIGYEGTAPVAVDRARQGIVTGNRVHDIDSSFNPGYDGNFQNGGGDASAAGIYVDGGADIVIERNEVTRCNFGIELASEHAGYATERIVVRNNLLHRNQGAGLILGGYDAQRGMTRNCVIRHNTLVLNDTNETWGGQIALQFFLENNEFKNNILCAAPTTRQAVVHYVTGGTAEQRAFSHSNIFDDNMYFIEGSTEAQLEFVLNKTGSGNKTYTGLTAWRGAVGSDIHSLFASPGFAGGAPSDCHSPTDFEITADSAARDRGDSSANFVPAAGERDFAGQTRVVGPRVDIGGDEYLAPRQAWRDIYFALPHGDTPAGDEEDPDHDGVINFLEYAQGLHPLLAETQGLPNITLSESTLSFRYQEAVPELAYQVETSPNLQSWFPVVASPIHESVLGRLYEFPRPEEGALFIRLRIHESAMP